jgi:hypothetical protein
MRQMTLLLLMWTVLALNVRAEEKRQIPQCFKVQSLIRMDDDHYWANWTNACSYTVDSVYVSVEFSDEAKRPLGSGLLSMHFVTPGAHQVTRFSTPSGVSDFRFVKVRRITTSLDEALRERVLPIVSEHTQ